jgi:hypothetical protein
MVFIAKKATESNRKDFISKYDNRYHVDGRDHLNNKFKLLDAINNSFKHVKLERNRHSDLIEIYGDLTFRSLTPSEGKIFFE